MSSVLRTQVTDPTASPAQVTLSGSSNTLRSRRGRSIAATTALGLLALGAPVHAATKTATATSASRELRISMGFAPRAGMSVHSDDANLVGRLGITEPLVRSNSSGEAIPLLATSWERVTSTAWRFKIRSGVTFHDGASMDAAAVVNSITRAVTAPTPPRSLRGTGMTATAIDSSTVEITTRLPDPLVPLRLSSPGSAIVSPDAFKGTAVSPIGTGIYKVDNLVGEQRVELVAFDKYWGKAPTIKKVESRFISDPAARVSALRAGEVDLIEGIPPALLDTVRKDSNLRALIFDIPRTTSVYLNTSQAPFENVAARRAIDLAIDRAAIATTLLEGAALPAAGYFGPAVGWDPDKVPAKQNLDEARKQAALGKLTGKVRLWTYPARAELPEVAVAIKDMLGRAGIEVEITVADYGKLEPDALAGKHDMFLLSRSYMVDVPDPAAFLASDFTCNGSYNLNRHCDTRMDTEVAAMGSLIHKGARERAFTSIARQLDLEVIGVPILHDRARIGHSKNLTGLVPNPLEQILLTSNLRLAA